MEVIEAIKTRRSIRKFKQEKVSKDILEQIVDASRYSPSWCNGQIARYTFIDNKEIIENITNNALREFSFNQRTLSKAPGLLVLTYVNGVSGRYNNIKIDNASEWEMFDSAIACQNFCLAAHNYNIGTCIFGIFDSEEIKKIIKIEDNETIAALIVYGYKESDLQIPKRLDVEKISRFIN